MRIKKGKKTEKGTICWECANYSRCSWSVGIPVKGWTAKPTLIVNKGHKGEKTLITHSFLVEACPQFKADRKRRVVAKEIADIIGKSTAATSNLLYRKGFGTICDRLKEKGYKLYAYKIDKKRAYYIEKL